MSDMTLSPSELPYDRRRFSRYWDFYRVPPLRRDGDRPGGLILRQVLGSAPSRLQRDRSSYFPNRPPSDRVLVPEDYCTAYINGGQVTPDRLTFALRLFDAPPEPPRIPRPAPAVPVATLAAPLAVPPAASPPPLSPWQIMEVDSRRFLAAYRLRRDYPRYFLQDLDAVRAANPSLYRYYEDGLDDDSTDDSISLDSVDLAGGSSYFSSSSSSSSSSADSDHNNHDQHRRNRDDDDDDDLDYDDATRASLARFVAIELVGLHEGGRYQGGRVVEGGSPVSVTSRRTRLAASPTRYPTPRGWWSPNIATDVLPDRYTGAMMFTSPSGALSTHSNAGYRRDGGGRLVRFRRASSAPAVISLRDVITEDKQTQGRIVHRDPSPSMPIKQRLTGDDTIRATLFDGIRTLHRSSRGHSNADTEPDRKAYEAIATLFGWEPWAKGELDMPGVRILPWSVDTSVRVNMSYIPRQKSPRDEEEQRGQPRSDPDAPEPSEGYGTAARTSAAVTLERAIQAVSDAPSVGASSLAAASVPVLATVGHSSITATSEPKVTATSNPRQKSPRDEEEGEDFSLFDITSLLDDTRAESNAAVPEPSVQATGGQSSVAATDKEDDLASHDHSLLSDPPAVPGQPSLLDQDPVAIRSVFSNITHVNIDNIRKGDGLQFTDATPLVAQPEQADSGIVPGPSIQATGGQGSVTATPKGKGPATSEPRRRLSWSEGDDAAFMVDWRIISKQKAPATLETYEDYYDDPDPDEQAEVWEDDSHLFGTTALDLSLEEAESDAIVPRPPVQATEGQSSATGALKGKAPATSEQISLWLEQDRWEEREEKYEEDDDIPLSILLALAGSDPDPDAPGPSGTGPSSVTKANAASTPKPDSQTGPEPFSSLHGAPSQQPTTREPGSQTNPEPVPSLQSAPSQQPPTREPGSQTTIKDSQTRDPKASSPVDPPTSQKAATAGESSAAAGAVPAGAESGSLDLASATAEPPLFSAAAKPQMMGSVLPSLPEEPSRPSRVRTVVKKAFRTETLKKPFLKLRESVRGRKTD